MIKYQFDNKETRKQGDKETTHITKNKSPDLTHLWTKGPAEFFKGVVPTDSNVTF